MSDSIMQMPSEMHVQMHHHHHHHHPVFTPGLKQKRDGLRSPARCWEFWGGLSGVRRGVSRFITADQQGAAAPCWRQLAQACSRRERLRSDVRGAC